jgi:small subunit ribosomal protein S2
MKIEDDNAKFLKMGMHFGHKKSRWHPSMTPYVLEKKNNVYIIDIDKSKEKLAEALECVEDIYSSGHEAIFIGTKPNSKSFLKVFCEENNLLYVNDRWIGGIITNFKTIGKRIKRYQDLEIIKASADYEKMTNKEKRPIDKEIEKLSNSWRGLRSLKRVPRAIFLLDIPSNYLAIEEAKKKNLTILGIADTDADIRKVDYPIPANDESLLVVKYVLDEVKKSIDRGRAKVGSVSEETSSEKNTKSK